MACSMHVYLANLAHIDVRIDEYPTENVASDWHSTYYRYNFGCWHSFSFKAVSITELYPSAIIQLGYLHGVWDHNSCRHFNCVNHGFCSLQELYRYQADGQRYIYTYPVHCEHGAIDESSILVIDHHVFPQTTFPPLFRHKLFGYKIICKFFYSDV